MPASSSALPVTEDMILEWFASGAKKSEDCLIGSEHEKFIYHLDSLEPAAYEDIAKILNLLKEKSGGEPMIEDGKIIGLKLQSGASVTLEPGGQLELSGAPLKNLHQTCQEITCHINEMREICSGLNLGMLGIGYLPHKKLAEIPKMPKKRYILMREWMPKTAPLGLEMMHLTTTIQVNLDYLDEADMARKMRVAACLQPFATALFASSPLADGKDSNLASKRAESWLYNDPARTGIPQFIFRDDFGYAHWMNYLMDVPVYFINRGNDYIDIGGVSFRNLLANPQSYAPITLDDFINHASTIFPDVRLKNFIEMRGADCSNKAMICALPAFWVGLLYDADILEKTYQLIADWHYHDLLDLRKKIITEGMNAAACGKSPYKSLYEFAEILLPLAKEGLKRRSEAGSYEDESIFLKPLEEIVAKRETISDTIRTLFQTTDGNLHKIYQTCRL